MGVVALLAVVVVASLAFLAVWPPAWAPEPWRRITRPLRHRARPRYYRHHTPWQQVHPEERSAEAFDWDGGTTDNP